MSKKSARGRAFWKGFCCGAPVMLGYLPVSFAFAVASGLPWQMATLISMTNFTSAGQLAGAGLMATGAPLAVIGITVFVVNLRYGLLSLSLSQKMRRFSLIERLVAANGVTDEVYVLVSQQPGALSGWFFCGLATGPYIGWIAGTLMGGLLGGVLPSALISALGIVLYAMFIAIVVPVAKRSRPVAVVTATAILLACIFRYVPYINRTPSGFSLIIAAVAAAAMGAILRPVPQQEDIDNP